MAAVIRGGHAHGGEIHDHGSGALAHLVDAGRLRPIGSQVLPLAEARVAYTQVLGADYTGTEVAAQGPLLSTRLAGTLPGRRIRWMLRGTAPRLLPELGRTCRTPPMTAACGGGGRGTHRPAGRRGLDGYVQLSTGGKGAHPVPDLVRRGPP